MNSDAAIEIKGLEHFYGRNKVLHGFDFIVEKGKTLFLGEGTIFRLYQAHNMPVVIKTYIFAGSDVCNITVKEDSNSDYHGDLVTTDGEFYLTTKDGKMVDKSGQQLNTEIITLSKTIENELLGG